ncbi:MAG: type IV pilus assembly protein PilM [Candidatus Pacebacteria bacterium]|nr:type IV pilus assembly protein PilM [Candidatus Paceibacterota bacterium]
MTNFFKGFFGGKKESVIGIDIGTSAIKVVQISRKGQKVVLDTYGALALGPYVDMEIGRATNLSVEKTVEALGDVLKEANITTRQCGIAIPFASSLMTVIEMPDVSVEQLVGMIPIEARKYIPVPISEVMLDWSVIPSDEYTATGKETTDVSKTTETVKKKKDVLIVAIHKEMVAKYQDIVKKTDLNASFFEIELFSTMRSVLEQENVPVGVLDMGAASTKLYVIERGAVRVSHTVNRGSQDVTLAISKSLGIPVNQAEVIKRDPNLGGHSDDKGVLEAVSLVTDHIFSEASRVFFSYQKKHQKNISKIILVGGGIALAGLTDKARKALKIEVEKGDPFSKVEAPAFLDEVLKKVGPEFAVAVGVALRRLQEV